MRFSTDFTDFKNQAAKKTEIPGLKHVEKPNDKNVKMSSNSTSIDIEKPKNMKITLQTAGQNSNTPKMPGQNNQAYKIAEINDTNSTLIKTEVNKVDKTKVLLTKSQRLSKIQEIKRIKFPKAGKGKLQASVSNKGVGTNQDMKLIIEKLIKTEISPGLQQTLDITYATKGKEWNNEWDDKNIIKTQKETQHKCSNQINTEMKYNQISRSVKRKLENDSESEIKSKIVIRDDYTKIKETYTHQDKSQKQLNLDEISPDNAPQAPPGKSYLEQTQEQHQTEDIQVKVEDEIIPVIEQSNIEVIKPEV